MKKLMPWIYIVLTACTVEPIPILRMGEWQGKLIREDGNHIIFNFEIKEKNDSLLWIIKNGEERIEVTDVLENGDSLFVQMPVFESSFKLVKVGNNKLKGVWTKAASTGFLDMPFEATAGITERFPVSSDSVKNISGKWSVRFFRVDGSPRPAIAEFTQKGNDLSGTFITPTGDYRYLKGVVNGDSLQLSTFDGSHAYLFKGYINSDSSITKGFYYSGATSTEPWEAMKNDTAALPDVAAMYMREGEEKLNFRFRDLDGKQVSITDERFKNKVVIVQIMGSWCPNCMDETAFLSNFYKKNKDRGVEIVALAYEYYEDFNLAVNSVRKFQKRFDVQYPMLVTGVTVTDTLRTEKTLPQLTKIKSFPSTIFIGKNGKVVKIHAGFEGPGTGSRYKALQEEFAHTVDQLLKQ
jgi:thiol-disulfide isomerase/thioredoxin